MKKTFVVGVALFAFAGSAGAADLPVKAPPVPYVTSSDWTGFYAGGHVGNGWINEDSTLLSTTGTLLNPLGSVISADRDGFLGGLQLGYNYQVQNWVLGIAGDVSWTNVTASTATPSTTIPGAVTNTQATTNWYSTLTGRAGVVWNNSLLYVKGGGAWINENYSGNAIVAGTTVTVNSVTDTRGGWTIGGGLEWRFSPKWSIFAEYDYLDFGSKSYTFTTNVPGVTSTSSITTNVSLLKGGINYHF